MHASNLQHLQHFCTTTLGLRCPLKSLQLKLLLTLYYFELH